MAENVAQSVEVPIGISVFGSLITEMAPQDLPEGVSPDNQDVAFLPGSVQSRPCLRKLYPTLANGVTVTYSKTYVQPNQQPITLVLASDGKLYKEDVINAPGVLVQIGLVTPGSYASSITAFGKEYIAFHNGIDGTDSPRQFDGTFLDRVSQEGPGAPVVAAEEVAGGSSNIVSTTQYASTNITSISETGNTVVVEIVEFSVTQPLHQKNIKAGDFIRIAGVGIGGYNGIFEVTGLDGFRGGVGPVYSWHLSIALYNPTSGLAPDITGHIDWPFIEVSTATPVSFSVGDTPTIAGSGVANYNGDWVVRSVEDPNDITLVINTYSNAPDAAGTISIVGNIGIGLHGVVCSFLTRQGYITKPSSPVYWNATGGKRVSISQLPIGPPNVVARILSFTGANGSRYFNLPANVSIPNPAGGAPLKYKSTWILDNTSDHATVDFADTTLFDGQGIDIPGNNLFNEFVLQPSIGCFNYASRMFWWGMKKVITNLVNMSFDGGYLTGVLTQPLGWNFDPSSASGTLTTTDDDANLAWQITGDGTANNLGMLTQSLYRDYYGIAIASPATKYTLGIWAKKITGGLGDAGNLVVEIFSPGTGGVIANATIPAAQILESGGFLRVNFSAATPAVIPADLILRVYCVNLPFTYKVIIDELSITPTDTPNDLMFAVSYVENPEAFDIITGRLGATEDDTRLQCCFQYKDTLNFLTYRGLHATRDLSGGEPSSWETSTVSDRCGAVSPRACDSGENFSAWVSSPVTEPPTGRGLYVYTGGAVYKISQEIQDLFDDINPLAQSSIWCKNDPVNRRFYVAVPINGATAPNIIYPLDYRELDTASDIASRPPVHISFTGKMICSDLSRKWTKWNIIANCGDLLQRPGGLVAMCLGAGNGQQPGAAPGFANVYQLDPTKYTDDDYGQVNPYYVTHFVTNHEQEAMLQLGLHRKLYKRYAIKITGVGTVSLTPLANSMFNPYPSTQKLPLAADSIVDMGGGLNVSTERCAFKVFTSPLPGQTDNGFNMGKLIITLMQEPMSPIRFGAL